jgi:hypothetical protein
MAPQGKHSVDLKLALFMQAAVNHMEPSCFVPVHCAPGIVPIGLREFTRQQLPGRTTEN